MIYSSSLTLWSKFLWDGKSVSLIVSKLLAVKLDQLIRAVARNRLNDEMTRLRVQCKVLSVPALKGMWGVLLASA